MYSTVFNLWAIIYFSSKIKIQVVENSSLSAKTVVCGILLRLISLLFFFLQNPFIIYYTINQQKKNTPKSTAKRKIISELILSLYIWNKELQLYKRQNSAPMLGCRVLLYLSYYFYIISLKSPLSCMTRGPQKDSIAINNKQLVTNYTAKNFKRFLNFWNNRLQSWQIKTAPKLITFKLCLN